MDGRAAEVRVVIAGCGEVTEHKHLRALEWVEGVRCVGLLDPDEGARRRVAGRYGIPLEPGEADALVVATPPAAHLEAARGKEPVLVEKPLCLSGEDGRAFEAMARARTVLVGFHMRHHRLIQEARAMVMAGRLGAVESVHVRWASPRGDEGLPAWRFRRASGGGALWEIGVHAYDLWRYLTGLEVESVAAVSRSGSREDESAEVTAWLSAGALATASLSERAPHQIEVEVRGGQGRVQVDCLRFEGLRFHAAGTAPGQARVRLAEARRFLTSLPRGLASMRRGGDYLESYAAQWRHFREVAAGRAAPLARVADGVVNSRIARAAAWSAASGGVPCRLSGC